MCTYINLEDRCPMYNKQTTRLEIMLHIPMGLAQN